MYLMHIWSVFVSMLKRTEFFRPILSRFSGVDATLPPLSLNRLLLDALPLPVDDNLNSMESQDADLFSHFITSRLSLAYFNLS